MDNRTLSHSRLCLALTADGLTAYGNSAALKSLARWLEWIANAPAAEHFECHASLALQTEETILNEELPRRVWTLTENDLAAAIKHIHERTAIEEGLRRLPFELTFMHVSESELDQMAKHQASGLLPSSWVEENDNAD